jgi:putative RecB family exonuclease
MTTLYSHSRLSTFETCRKKFHFRYVLQIPQETEGIEAFVGKRVHEVLERLYTFLARQQVPSLRRVVERYHALFDESFDPDKVVIVKEGFDVDHYRALGVRCLEHYYRTHYPFESDETLAVEEHVKFPLDAEGRYGIQGFVDRIGRARDGAIEIHDFKTGSYVPSQKALDSDRQLALYQIGIGDRFGDDTEVRLVWHYLARGQTRTSSRTPEQLETLKTGTLRLVEQAESEQAFPARKNNLCAWCEYKPLCPAWGAAPADPSSPPDAARAVLADSDHGQPRLL